jgi:tetratricopeptide (TPR) repeat protein
MIGVPVAWLTVSQKTTPATELASREAADLKTFDVAEDAAPGIPATVPKLPAVVFKPRAEVAANHGEERASEAPPPAQAFAKDYAEAPQARADNAAPTVLAQALRAPPVIAPAAPAAAPAPPPMVMRETSAASKAEDALAGADTRDIVVTSARRRGGAVPDRGDWNACTINDPKRSLAACRYLINPGATGIKGQAAAYLADGLSLAWQGNMDRAIAAFDRAIMITPKSSLAYLNRGLAYQRQGDTDRALADLDRAVRLAPSAARGYYNRSLLLRERGEGRRADTDQVRAVNLDADYEAVVN